MMQGQTNVKSSLEFSIPWMMTRTGGIHRASYSRSSWTCYMRRWHGHATTSGLLAQAPVQLGAGQLCRGTGADATAIMAVLAVRGGRGGLLCAVMLWERAQAGLRPTGRTTMETQRPASKVCLPSPEKWQPVEICPCP
jgi:hypothetical protein